MPRLERDVLARTAEVYNRLGGVHAARELGISREAMYSRLESARLAGIAVRVVMVDRWSDDDVQLLLRVYGPNHDVGACYAAFPTRGKPAIRAALRRYCAFGVRDAHVGAVDAAAGARARAAIARLPMDLIVDGVTRLAERKSSFVGDAV